MSYSVNFKGKEDNKNPGLIKIEMILYKSGHPRVPKILSITGLAANWDQKKQQFRDSSTESLTKNQLLLDIKLKYTRIIEEWEKSKPDWTPTEWSHFENDKKPEKAISRKKSVKDFLSDLDKRFSETIRVKNGEIIDSSSNGELYRWLSYSLDKFTKEKYNKNFSNYYFENIDEEFFKDYAIYLKMKGAEKGNKGGVVNRLKNLRATLNHAIKAGIPNVNVGAYIPVQSLMSSKKTDPKTIPFDIIKKIEEMDKSKFTLKQQLHIDAFLFSFYAGGMCNADVVNCTHNYIKEGFFQYERRKTTKEAKMPIIPKAEKIINKYKGKCYGDYIFPIITDFHKTAKQKRRKARSFTDRVNKTLVKVAKEIGYKRKITWNAARGTYITRMISNKYSPELVAEHAGNSPEIIYKHYYKEFNNEELAQKINNIL